MKIKQSTQEWVGIALIKFHQESAKWARPSYHAILIRPWKGVIFVQILNISKGLVISNHCTIICAMSSVVHSSLTLGKWSQSMQANWKLFTVLPLFKMSWKQAIVTAGWIITCCAGISYRHLLELCLSHFWSSSLKMHVGRQWKMAQVFGPQNPCGSTNRITYSCFQHWPLHPFGGINQHSQWKLILSLSIPCPMTLPFKWTIFFKKCHYHWSTQESQERLSFCDTV